MGCLLCQIKKCYCAYCATAYLLCQIKNIIVLTVPNKKMLLCLLCHGLLCQIKNITVLTVPNKKNVTVPSVPRLTVPNKKNITVLTVLNKNILLCLLCQIKKCYCAYSATAYCAK